MAYRGKNIVITGGASGIGLELCKQFMNNGSSNVASIDIEENLEEFCKMRTNYPKQHFISINMDVSNKKDIEAAYEKIIKSFGHIDIVINVAGIFNDLDVQRSINVNVGGVINSTLVAMDHMSKEKGGKGGFIVNMSSIVGLDPIFIMPVYTATKFAVIGFTRCLANKFYYEKTDITFAVICPGATITPMFTNFTEKILYPEMGDESYRLLNRLPKQSAADVSKCILGALDKCENGAVWIIENKEIHPIKMAKYWNTD